MKRSEAQALFVISVAAEMAGMHPQTLRIYERKGLVEPYRTPGGTRRYSQADVDRLALISDLTDQGLNLEGVRRVIALTDQLRALNEQIVALHQQAIEQEKAARAREQEVHRSYRRELVLRSDLLPQRRSGR